GAVVWMLVSADRPFGPQSASAAPGIPDAGSQRRQLITAIESLDTNLERLRQSLEQGQLKIAVSNVRELADAVGRASK
ncbi:MAG: hypothetical protein KDA25_08605, partial [Phycisphaerales bacterium]|nr:hypothetical protein [Phycisphaerales bacterium]